MTNAGIRPIRTAHREKAHKTIWQTNNAQTTHLDRMKQFGYERTAHTHDECGHKADSHGAQRKGTQDHMADEQLPAELTELEEYRNI